MRPGNTSLPVTSITSLALVGRMSGCTAAILPLRMATSLMPSMPEAGQMTPAAAQKLVEGGADRHGDLLCFQPAEFDRRSLSRYEAYFVFYKSKARAMICSGGGGRIGLFAEVARRGECIAESKKRRVEIRHRPWPLSQRPGFLIRRLHQIHVALFQEACGEFEVTPLQYSLLSALAARETADQTTLAADIALDRTTTTGALKRLAARNSSREPSMMRTAVHGSAD